MMPLDLDAIDINQLQQIMRLTGTPPASLISRMPSHEVRHMDTSSFPCSLQLFCPPHLESGHRPMPTVRFTDRYRPIKEFFYCLHCLRISLCSHSTYFFPLWLTVFVTARVLCQCILMSLSVATHWFWNKGTIFVILAIIKVLEACNTGRMYSHNSLRTW